MAWFSLAITPAGAGQDLDSLVSPGPLADAHSELTGLRQCTSCHTAGKRVPDDKCLACHEELATRVREGSGYHRDKDECVLCHSDHQGEAFNLVNWDLNLFDHDETGYPLVGLHQNVEQCQDCHREPNAPARAKTVTYLLNDTRCIACHEDVHHGQLGEDCSRCHGMETPFAEIDFDHSTAAYPLVGAHRRVQCESCHPNKKWKGIAFSTCTSCHRDPHEPSLGTECQRCHNEHSWDSTLDHDTTRFPLLGKHEAVACDACHENQVFRGFAFESCTDCHADDTHFGQFEEDCDSCHVEEGFETVLYDHDESRYPLTGKHIEVTCDECHREEQASLFPAGIATAVRYKPLETKCRFCHVDAHYAQLSSECETCHVTDDFRGDHVMFEHNFDSSFALLGKHADALCDQCHRLESGPFPGGSGLAVRYKPMAAFCASCHDNRR